MGTVVKKKVGTVEYFREADNLMMNRMEGIVKKMGKIFEGDIYINFTPTPWGFYLFPNAPRFLLFSLLSSFSSCSVFSISISLSRCL